MRVWLWRRCGAVLAMAVAGALTATGASAAAGPGAAVGPVSPGTSPALIKKLAAAAYAWGLPAEFIYRFGRYNDLVTAPRNTLGGEPEAAAWNNQGTNAGNASVLYINAMLNLSGQKGHGNTKELVLTVPPSRKSYYVVNILDGFINTVGSIGTRTTPSARPQTYLLAGPTSRYAHQRIARIGGFTYRVLTLDTNLDWMLIRIRADSLVPAANPASMASTLRKVAGRFGMSTLAQFEANGHRPDYFKPGRYTPTQGQLSRAQKWSTAPAQAVPFFTQMGQSLRLSPLPTAHTGLNGVPLQALPSWAVPQYGATKLYRNPSLGQQRTLALFAPIGLTANGFQVPRNWGPAQLHALQAGYEAGQQKINDLASAGAPTQQTNYWGYVNTIIGTYPNTPKGYEVRSVVVLSGGGANVPPDAVYAQINTLNGNPDTQLNGNNTYTLTFTPPVANPQKLPVVGTLPPTVNDSQGNPLGFWSIHVYQPDPSQSAAPFITQASVLNTAYSAANIAVTAVNPSAGTITVKPTAWGPLVKSTPILFSSAAAQYGLKPGVAYYVATTPIKNTNPKTRTTTYSFQVSATWQQQLSADNVPIQGANGKPGSIVHLTNPGGPVTLQWGPIQPVSQLGSQQLTSGKLAKNPDGSVTIWIAPKLPPGAPATNWIPSPSTAYYNKIYPGVAVPTDIRPMIRIYYPAPGSNTQASILPPPNGSMGATYVFPALQKAS